MTTVKKAGVFAPSSVNVTTFSPQMPYGYELLASTESVKAGKLLVAVGLEVLDHSILSKDMI